jgi:hypothetical protein
MPDAEEKAETEADPGSVVETEENCQTNQPRIRLFFPLPKLVSIR